jgi:hypothetical protein
LSINHTGFVDAPDKSRYSAAADLVGVDEENKKYPLIGKKIDGTG